MSYQNYTTIDSYKPSRTTVIRVSEIHEILRIPKKPKSDLVHVPDGKPHFVVAKYESTDWSRTAHGHIELRSSELVMCEHFVGETAEGDAMAYYLGLVDPDEFPPKALSTDNFPSYQEAMKYLKRD